MLTLLSTVKARLALMDGTYDALLTSAILSAAISRVTLTGPRHPLGHASPFIRT